jgi:hypothetical protein
MSRFALIALIALVAAALACGGARAEEPAPEAASACPPELPRDTRCYAGQDRNGAYYSIALPNAWNGALVIHTHGGPSLTPPSPKDPLTDLQRFNVIVAEGFAWASSSYRHAGFGMRDAAADTDNLRQIFWAKFGRPKYTLIHGQSWGAAVAVKTSELYGLDASGKRIYDGLILTSGVLGGATKSYDFRADLRAVYQFYCHNLPRANEDDYPLWEGLASDSRLSREDIAARVDECTGGASPASSRSATQVRNLKNIANVVRIEERSLANHMEWATLVFRDLVDRQLGRQNPFSNIGVIYAGSDDDAALNKGVQRFAATQAGVDGLADDADFSGRLNAPTLTLHAERDPTAFVELENAFREIVVKAGYGELLMQSFTDEDEHRREATPEYAALLRTMIHWIATGRKPTLQSLAVSCQMAQKTYGEACHFDPGFFPQPLTTRVYDRIRPEPRSLLLK